MQRQGLGLLSNPFGARHGACGRHCGSSGALPRQIQERAIATTGSMTISSERLTMKTSSPIFQWRLLRGIAGWSRDTAEAPTQTPRRGSQNQQSAPPSRLIRESRGVAMTTALPWSTDGGADRTIPDSVRKMTAKICDGGIPACRRSASFVMDSTLSPDTPLCSGLPQTQGSLYPHRGRRSRSS
jgi:hypothetical protein